MFVVVGWMARRRIHRVYFTDGKEIWTSQVGCVWHCSLISDKRKHLKRMGTEKQCRRRVRGEEGKD